ncbi:MAG: farnesyl diphosphate synthase [Candidatus Cloacimonadota bacterium]|nr:farnesyl diphosphate synthase [Candidatus Cloacimonadota bacterium]
MLVEKYFESRKNLVNEGLKKSLDPKGVKPKRLMKAMRYSVFNGGKRLRPILLFATYEMLRGRKNVRTLKTTIPAAVALELVHSASLIHDDLPSMDDSDERRGKPSSHIKYDEATAILTGDALITKAFEVLTQIKNKEKSIKCINALSRSLSTRGIIGGQAVDVIGSRKKIRINELRYIHMKKTGSLLQAAVELACIMNGAEEKVFINLNNYALKLGLSYQIIDDILDEIGIYDVLGKAPGSDFRNNKATYPALIGLEKSKKAVVKLLKESRTLLKDMKHKQILIEFVNNVESRLP